MLDPQRGLINRPLAWWTAVKNIPDCEKLGLGQRAKAARSLARKKLNNHGAFEPTS